MSEERGSLPSIYLRRLASLGGRHRSLFLPRLAAAQYIDLRTLGLLHGEPAFALLEAALQRKRKTICATVDSRSAAVNEASLRLKRLQRTAQVLFEERGVKDLHIGWPFVRGRLLSGHKVRCPLLLIPVEFISAHSKWVLEPRENAPIQFNRFFLLAYSLYNQMPIAEALMEESFGERNADALSFSVALYELLEASALDIHFNTDMFRNELIPFETFSSKTFNDQHEPGRLKLFSEAVLGIFPQAGSYLAPDYRAMMEEGAIDNMETFFLKRNRVAVADIKEEDILAGYPQDAWQESALRAIKAGRSIVVSGPPGTGKSQLICNVVCDTLASRKTVLVVCQKRAALEVVYERLSRLGLATFAAAVHDFKNDRAALYAKAARQISAIDDYRTTNNSLDSIQLERKFLRISRRIDQIVVELSALKNALFDRSECGFSAKELYLQSDLSQSDINLTDIYQCFRRDMLESEFLPALRAYARYATQLDGADYPLAGRPSFAGLGMRDRQVLADILSALPTAVARVERVLHEALGGCRSWAQASRLAERQDTLGALLKLLEDEAVYRRFCALVRRLSADEPPALDEIEQTAMDCFAAGNPPSLSADEAERTAQAAERSLALWSKPAGRWRWMVFSKDKRLALQAMACGVWQASESALEALRDGAKRRAMLHRLVAMLQAMGEEEPPNGASDRSAFKRWFILRRSAVHAVSKLQSMQDCLPLSPPAEGAAWRAQLGAWRNAAQATAILEAQWKARWGAPLVKAWTANPARCAAAQATLEQDFDALCDFDALYSRMTTPEQTAIDRLRAAGWGAVEAVEALFVNSLYLSWIHHLEERSPALRLTSSGRLNALETELRDLIREKQELSGSIVLMRARERVVEELKFNRLSNRVSYRSLLHELIKKRKIFPVRKLAAQFGEELFRLLPCWMASPEAVSAIFPLAELFDVVIFDEASQCFAEQGIPAIYRGRQTVVVGDNQQLRPNDLYRVRWQEGEEDHPDAAAESLLDLAEQYLERLPLRTHYRSRAAALIDFSNQCFYEGQLQFIPYFNDYMQADLPIVYHHIVGGQWQDQTNPIEADEVARLTLEITRRQPEKTLGVITFNAPQQALIMDRLEAAFAQAGHIMPATLAVKNIENIQGEERDIILFSVGYAPDASGKVRIQFGSLSASGGENRLNVAVTRARERIVLVTSLLPDQLPVEHAQNEGPRLLKEYLRYAWRIAHQRVSGDTVPIPACAPQNAPTLSHAIVAAQKGMLAGCPIRMGALPFADLSVHAERAVGLALTDDALYHDAPSAKAFHALTPQALQERGWEYIAAYSRNYCLDRKALLAALERFAGALSTR